MRGKHCRLVLTTYLCGQRQLDIAGGRLGQHYWCNRTWLVGAVDGYVITQAQIRSNRNLAEEKTHIGGARVLQG